MIDIDLYTWHQGVYENSKPDKGVKFIPEWFRKLDVELFSPDIPGGRGQTMKTCPGFVELFSHSVVMPLWADVDIYLGKKGTKDCSYAFASESFIVGNHPNVQFSGFTDDENWQHAKMLSPWMMKASKPIKVCFVQPMWNSIDATEYIRILPGIIDIPSKLAVQPNVNMMLRRGAEEKYFRFHQGMPLAHLVLMTTEKFSVKSHLISVEEMDKMTYGKNFRINFLNSFREFMKGENKK